MAESVFEDTDGKTVLFHAAENDMRVVIRGLYVKGFDLNTTDDDGKTAVFYANENNSMNALCELINDCAEFNLNEIDGKAVLFYAAENDLPGVIRKLHYKGLDLNTTDEEGKTAVFYANENNSMDALCELIRYCAEFNLDEIDGKAVLFYAAENDLFWVIEELADRGFDLNTTDDEGKTAVFHAIKNNSIDAICELIHHVEFNEIDGKAVLFYAAENDLPGAIKKLADTSFDLNTTDDEGKTAVFYAVNNNSMDALCELIGDGAAFNLDEIDGKAVLFYAAKKDLDGVITRLYSKNLDLNTTDDEGKTAVFHAKKNNNMIVLCELIGCNAQFDLNKNDQKALLFYAANKRELLLGDVVKPLRDAGLDLNTTDEKGKTALFYADNDCMKALMEFDDVRVNARDLYGRTPLFYALQNDSASKARYLIEKGANLQLKDSCNVSLFSFFVEHCISWNVKKLQSFTPELFQDEQELKALILGTFDIIYCQAPLLCVSGSHLRKSYMIFNKENVSEALIFVRECLNQDTEKVEDINSVASMINENKTNVPCMLSALNKLGANPIAADSAGNTAVHYATLLPFLGVPQETVMDILKKLREFGAIFDLKNHQGQSPLQFLLSSYAWKVVSENKEWQLSIRGLIEVCRFLLSNGCSINDASQNGESVFHRIIVLIQQGLEINDEASRKMVSQVLIDILKLLPPSKNTGTNIVNNVDKQVNSPLHLWASLTLKSPQDYGRVTKDPSFENILQTVLRHLLECGAKLNPRNANEETPLHLCKTWTAVKLLLEAGANPNDVDSSGRSPLVFVVKENLVRKKMDHFYPDVTEEPDTFWKSALAKGLDAWTADKEGESVLSVLIESEAFVLAKALVEVACKENYATNDIKLSFLNTICEDISRRTHWKTILVEVTLKSASKNHLSVDSPLRLCCRNIVQFGMFDKKPDSFQQKTKDVPVNDDGEPPTKKRRKDELSIKEERESIVEQAKYDSVHCKIAKQLLSYGGVNTISIPDSSGESCLDIAKDCPALQDLLTKPIEIDTIPLRIPWTSVSQNYEGLLAKVARRQECEMVDQIWYNTNNIGSGSFGLIFAGINEKDGREVAIKRIEKLRTRGLQVKREIQNLTALADCEQVVRYISFFEGKHFSYVFLELMEGNLEEYLKGSRTDATQGTDLCKDVVMGIKFLHEQKILHRDLKPQNILYKVHPKLCLKIADFGLSRIIDSVSTTVYGTLAGTRCWMARELLESCKDFSESSDMFSCGLILHYILSGQKHPYSPSDCTNKSELQIVHDTEHNIFTGQLEGWDDTLTPEATHLVKRMLESNEENRPSAEEALEHPLFWCNNKKVDFLKTVGNQPEFADSSSNHDVTNMLKKNYHKIVKHGNWWKPKYMHAIFKGLTKTGEGTFRKFYDKKSVVDLVRFIRNVYDHFRVKTFVFSQRAVATTEPAQIEQLLFEDFVFLEYFPDLVMEVYKAVTTYGWDQTRDEIQSTMK